MTAKAPAPRSSHPQSYRPDIDGLRAVAVMLVVLFHAGISAVPGGFVGVDVFFVISGYLITRLIAPEIAAGAFSIAHFYERRIRRLFPALLAVVLACLVTGFFIQTPLDYRDLGRSALATIVFIANFYFAKNTGYFDGAAEEKPLLHMWSLAVEEQFYLVFPLALWLVVRFARLRLAQIAVACWGLSLAASIIQTYYDPVNAYFLPHTRVWQLLTGSAIALGLVPTWRSAVAAEAAALAGLAAIVSAALLYSSATPFPGWQALLPCLGAGALVHAGQARRTLAGRALGAPPVLFIGLASYSIYVWHWPILVFAKYWLLRELLPAERWGIIGLALLAGLASWRFIERPFRGSGAALPGRRIFAGAGAAVALVACVAGLADLGKGLPWRLDPAAAAIASASFEKFQNAKTCPQLSPKNVQLGMSCVPGTKDIPVSVILWGDSHARAIFAGFKSAANAAGINVGGLFKDGCPPLDGVTNADKADRKDCNAFREAVFEAVAGNKAITTVIIAARWGYYANGTRFGGEAGDNYFMRDSQTVTPSHAENAAVFARGLRRTVSRLQMMGKTVALIGPVPEIGVNVPNALAREIMRGKTLGFQPARAAFDARQALVVAQFAEFERAGIRVAYPHLVLCGAAHPQCRVSNDGQSLYADDDHLSHAGAALLVPMLTQLLRDATSKTGAQ